MECQTDGQSRKGEISFITVNERFFDNLKLIDIIRIKNLWKWSCKSILQLWLLSDHYLALRERYTQVSW